MSKTHISKRKILRIASIAVLSVLLITAVFMLLAYWEDNLNFSQEDDFDVSDSVIEYNSKQYALRDDVQSILVIGLDKFEENIDNSSYNNDQQADFLMLFVLDNSNKTYSAIQLSRDTMAEINILGVAGEKIDTFFGQLALAHTYGNGREVSCRNTADAVSGVLKDIVIDRYISFTMDAVPVITDLVGGVEVEITDDFSNIDDTLVLGETVVLHGEHALNFVRSRQGMSDATNNNRMSRQREFLSSLSDAVKVKSNEDENFTVQAVLELSEYLVSNYTTQQLENLMDNLNDYEFEGIHVVDGEAKMGEKYMEFYPDSKSVDEIVVNLLYKPVV